MKVQLNPVNPYGPGKQIGADRGECCFSKSNLIKIKQNHRLHHRCKNFRNNHIMQISGLKLHNDHRNDKKDNRMSGQIDNQIDFENFRDFFYGSEEEIINFAN